LRAQAFTNPITNPVVISQIQSHTGGDWVKTRQKAVNTRGFQVKQEEDGLDIGHNTEVYGWLALAKGSGDLGGLTYEAIITPDQVTHNPYTVTWSQTFARTPSFFANMQTTDGGDPSHMRQSSVTTTNAVMWVEEETCSDAELAHTTEVIGVLAVDQGLAGGSASIEVGVASADLNAVNIRYGGSYPDPVVVAGVPTHNGDEELVIRISRIGSTSFDLYADLPNRCGSGGHASEDFGFMILNTGVTGPILAGSGTYGICAGGELCTPTYGCSSCDHSTGFDWVDVVSHVD